MTREHLYKLKELIQQLSKNLSDSEALEGIELFPSWKTDTDYILDNRVKYNGELYKMIQPTHHSQDDWTPDVAVSIWVKVDDPSVEWPEWKQPAGAHDAYKNGAKVSHNGKHWINTYGDGNSWEPGVYGWDLVE
jgi:hypothetical protein